MKNVNGPIEWYDHFPICKLVDNKIVIFNELEEWIEFEETGTLPIKE